MIPLNFLWQAAEQAAERKTMSRILLIDDDEDMLSITVRWLAKAGYEVSSASSGSAALKLLSEFTPDLILLDYAMPEMDGPAVLKAIRSGEATKKIPVLYRTGMDDIVTEGGEGVPEADGIIPKSEGKPFLLEAVSKALMKN